MNKYLYKFINNNIFTIYYIYNIFTIYIMKIRVPEGQLNAITTPYSGRVNKRDAACEIVRCPRNRECIRCANRFNVSVRSAFSLSLSVKQQQASFPHVAFSTRRHYPMRPACAAYFRIESRAIERRVNQLPPLIIQCVR
jgi:hypothetical protein